MKKICSFLIILIFINNNLIAQDLSNYKSFIMENFPEFIQHFGIENLNDFELQFETDVNLEENSIKYHKFESKYWDEYLNVYKAFIQFSPDMKNFVDLFSSSIAIEKRNDTYFGSVDADQGIILGNFKNKSTVLLAFTGPSGSYTGAKWYNNEIIIISGFFDESRSQIVPNIQIFDLKNKIRFFYESKKNTSKTVYISQLFNKIILE